MKKADSLYQNQIVCRLWLEAFGPNTNESPLSLGKEWIMRWQRAFVSGFVSGVSGLFCLVCTLFAFFAQARGLVSCALLLIAGMALCLIGWRQLKAGRFYDFDDLERGMKAARLLWLKANRPKRLNLAALSLATQVVIMLLALASAIVTPLAITFWIEKTFP